MTAPLPRRIVDACELPPDAVVLDPFAGSGTTLAAAKAAGLRSIGIEAEARWCDVIAERVGQGAFDFGGAA